MADNLTAFGFMHEGLPESAGTGRRLIRVSSTGAEVGPMTIYDCEEWMVGGWAALACPK
jgi:hypothetical protein